MADPIRLDPFQNIVEVGWGGKYAVLQFRALASGTTPPGHVAPVVELPQLGATFPVMGNERTSKLVRNPRQGYTHDSTDTRPGHSITIKTYRLDLHTAHANGTTEIKVFTDDGDTYWLLGDTHMPGDITAALAFYLSIGWESGEYELLSTETDSSPPETAYTAEDAGVLIFNLGAITGAIHARDKEADVKTIGIQFATGSVSGSGPMDGWNAVIGTYKKVGFKDFPVTATNMPDHWKDAEHERDDHGKSAETVRYRIKIEDLTVARV